MSAPFAGVRRIPTPQNEPNLTYAPGSAERAELKSRLAAMARRRTWLTNWPAFATRSRYSRDRSARSAGPCGGPGGIRWCRPYRGLWRWSC